MTLIKETDYGTPAVPMRLSRLRSNLEMALPLWHRGASAPLPARRGDVAERLKATVC